MTTKKPKLPMNKLRLAASLWVQENNEDYPVYSPKDTLEYFFKWLEERSDD